MTNQQLNIEEQHKAKIHELVTLLNSNPNMPYLVSSDDDGGGEYGFFTTGPYKNMLTFGYSDPFQSEGTNNKLQVQGDQGGWLEEANPHATAHEDAAWLYKTITEYIHYAENQ